MGRLIGRGGFETRPYASSRGNPPTYLQIANDLNGLCRGEAPSPRNGKTGGETPPLRLTIQMCPDIFVQMPNGDQPRPQRQSIRLPDYDYSTEGVYFITICTKNRECLFGEIKNGAMELSKVGQVVRNYWLEIQKHFENVQLDEFVIMPNHLHGIIILEKRVECIQPLQKNHVGVQYIEPAPGPAPTQTKYQHVTPKSIGSIIRTFKAAVTRWCRENSLEGQIWQRNYYEHVVRNEKSLNKIRQYILDNPLNWTQDAENPACCTNPKAQTGSDVTGKTTKEARYLQVCCGKQGWDSAP